jgi:hypothetical protein
MDRHFDPFPTPRDAGGCQPDARRTPSDSALFADIRINEAKGRRTALAISVILSEAKDLIAISTGTLVESP